MQHPFDNPETADASLLRGRLGRQSSAPSPVASKPTPTPRAAQRRGGFVGAVGTDAAASTRSITHFASSSQLLVQFPATLGCHPHASGRMSGAIC